MYKMDGRPSVWMHFEYKALKYVLKLNDNNCIYLPIRFALVTPSYMFTLSSGYVLKNINSIHALPWVTVIIYTQKSYRLYLDG